VETPLLKAAGPFPWYCSHMPTIVFYVLAVLLVVTLFLVMLWFFFLIGR
jgi:hypothetical protein